MIIWFYFLSLSPRSSCLSSIRLLCEFDTRCPFSKTQGCCISIFTVVWVLQPLSILYQLSWDNVGRLHLLFVRICLGRGCLGRWCFLLSDYLASIMCCAIHLVNQPSYLIPSLPLLWHSYVCRHRLRSFPPLVQQLLFIFPFISSVFYAFLVFSLCLKLYSY